MKSKKNQNYILIAFVLLVLALFFAPHILPTLSTVGITSLGCDKPNFNSRDPFYNNGTYQCTQTLGAKQGEFTLSPTNSRELFGVATEHTLTETAEIVKDECKFMFDNMTRKTVYTYTIMATSARWDYSGTWTCQTPCDPRTSRTGCNLPAGTELIGMTQIQCSRSCSSFDNHGTITGCNAVYRTPQGAIYFLDPSVIYDFAVKINMSDGSNSYISYLTQNNITAYNDLYRLELFQGSLKGTQSCPASPSVALFVGTNGNIKYVNRDTATALINSEMGLVDLYSIYNGGNTANTIYNQTMSSTASTGQYCQIANISNASILGSYISCTPVGSVTVPIWNLYINAESVGIHVPSGRPKIINVSTSRVESATRSVIDVKVKNEEEDDNFEASVKCKRDISPFSTTGFVKQNEIKDIFINYQGSGLISVCNVTVKSINSPQNFDTLEAKIYIYPFCPLDAPSTKHERVFTEFGCTFICPNYNGNTDIMYNTCSEIRNYDRCNYEDINGTKTCVSKNSYSGIHCINANGEYLTMNKYLDAVNDGKIAPFIPQQLPHKYFVVEHNGKPVCRYINEYGYKDGAELDELEFNYDLAFPEGTEASLAQLPQPTNETQVPEIPAKEGGLALPQDIILYIIGGAAVLGGGYLLLFKKVR